MSLMDIQGSFTEMIKNCVLIFLVFLVLYIATQLLCTQPLPRASGELRINTGNNTNDGGRQTTGSVDFDLPPQASPSGADIGTGGNKNKGGPQITGKVTVRRSVNPKQKPAF